MLNKLGSEVNKQVGKIQSFLSYFFKYYPMFFKFDEMYMYHGQGTHTIGENDATVIFTIPNGEIH
jgi:dolichyl-phosphate-mannose--protein O-mannosyl transferase